MTQRTARTLIACAFASILLTANAFADECKLGRIASMDFTSDGAIIVSGSMEGKPVLMALDTGSGVSGVDPMVANRLGLGEQRLPQGILYDTKGEEFQYVATVHDFRIGEMHGNNIDFAVWPSPLSSSGGIGGLVAADMLHHYDVDIDFGARKVNLFSQNHCPGQVVYWTNDNVAVVPMHVVKSGHIVLPVTLDGHELDALLDTGSTYSTLSMSFAHGLYGLSPDSPDMQKVGMISGAVQTAIYSHTFKTLNLQGLTIGSPTIHLRDNLVQYTATQAPRTGSRLSDLRESGGNTDFTLGVNELRHLHLYIAYQEQKLYISPASAPVAVAASAPQAAAAAPAGTTTAPPAPLPGAAASH